MTPFRLLLFTTILILPFVAFARASDCSTVIAAIEGNSNSLVEKKSFAFEPVGSVDVSTNDRIKCLIEGLSDWNKIYGADASLRNKLTDAFWGNTLPATKLRVMTTTLSYTLDDNLQNIASAREFLSADAVAALSWGARSQDDDTRLSSTLVMGDVITPEFSCIPAAHVADPNIGNANNDLSLRTRANLLAIGRVAANQSISSSQAENLTLLFEISSVLEKSIDAELYPSTFNSVKEIRSNTWFQEKNELERYGASACFADELTFVWAGEALVDLSPID